MRPLLEEDGIRFHPDGLTGFEPLSHRCGGEPIRASDAFGSVYGGRKKKRDKELGSPPQLLYPAHPPAVRPQARFGRQPPAVRAALRPEMCGQFQGVPKSQEMGSKTEGKRNSAVLIPQRLLPQEKSRGHSKGWLLFSTILKEHPFGDEPCVAISKRRPEKKVSRKVLNFLITRSFHSGYSLQVRVLCVADRSPQAPYMRATEHSEALSES